MTIPRSLVLVLCSSALARAAALPVQLDGDFAEWTAPPLATDAAGDAGSSGIDFTRLEVANDDVRLFVRFDTGVEVQPDELHDIVLAIDTDNDSGTGDSVAGIGAELTWNLGQRSGTFWDGGNSYSVGHIDIGFLVAPTVSDVQFEVGLDRAAVPANGAALFPQGTIRVALFEDTGGGDELDGSAAVYTFHTTPMPVSSIALGRHAPDDVRIATYNVENDGLFDGGADAAALDNLFDAIDPDVWVINEVWNHDENEVVTEVEGFLPSGGGETWNGVKLDSGNVLVTRFPVLASWEPSPGDRITAVLLDARPQLSTDLLVVANHWNCCASDGARQDQADALIEFLDDARTPGGTIDLVAGTPIVAAGDFNLVGWRGQLETMITGDIADNGQFGPDSPPDWDGSDFETVTARHPDARITATWWSDTSTFSPGRLDWIFYTGSVLGLANHYALDTRQMTAANLATHGLLQSDTETASDHAPVVADFRAPSAGTGAPEVGAAGGTAGTFVRLDPAAPNPAHGGTTVRYALGATRDVRVDVHDVAGRRIRELDRGRRAAGTHAVRWDGLDAAGVPVAAGVYFVRLEAGETTLLRRVTVLR